MRRLTLLLLFYILSNALVSAQYKIDGKGWHAEINKSGKLISYTTINADGEEPIQFRTDKYAGPSFEGIELKIEDEDQLLFSGKKGMVKYSLKYENDNGILLVKASIENIGAKIHNPKYERLVFGLNTYMEKYPEWNKKFFPTMLRCEKTHFYGYAMSPLGKVFAFASPDPLASWNYEYLNYGTVENRPKAIRTGHRIYTVTFDMIHCLPLPQRHPQNLTSIKPGQKVSFNLYMKELSGLSELNDFYSMVTKAPIIELDKYTVAKYENIKGIINSKSQPKVMIFGPQNYATEIEIKELNNNLYSFEFGANRGVGNYKIVVTDEKGKMSEAMSYCRDDWSWYLNQARQEALHAKPTDTHHAECFYPLYSYFLARKHLPNKEVDEQCEEIFQEIFTELFDPELKEMRNGKFRIQDAATMIGVLTDRYQVTNNIEDMENAAGLVEFLIKHQREDGGYYSGHNTHYTSVIYLAKSIMEYLTSAKELAEKYPKWKENYKRHYTSVKKAIDDLAYRKDDVKTEGQMTFEDGMISCSATQLAFAALREPNADKKEKYKEVSLLLTDKHQCLTLLKIPDSRMNGATLRFWESQYTVNLMHGNMNTPCGWSAWKTYGIWYQYLLTGNEEFLKLAFNSLGSFMQLFDYETGKFRFSFTPDPYIECEQYLETPIGSGKAVLQPVVIGEQYIEPISYWHRYPHKTWRKKWGIDNFNHEVIKCMAEISLTNAYIVEQQDGSFNTYGCEVFKSDNNTLIINAKEKLVDKLHVNLKGKYNIKFRAKTTQIYKNISGLGWINEIPDDIKIY